jgi:hypothetical protein
MESAESESERARAPTLDRKRRTEAIRIEDLYSV